MDRQFNDSGRAAVYEKFGASARHFKGIWKTKLACNELTLRSMLTQAIIHLHRSVFEMKWNHHHHRYLRMQFPLTTQGFIHFLCLFKVEFEPQAHSVSQRCWTWCVQRRGWWDVGSLMLFTKIRSDSIEYTYTTVQVIYCHCRPSSEVLARLP